MEDLMRNTLQSIQKTIENSEMSNEHLFKEGMVKCRQK